MSDDWISILDYKSTQCQGTRRRKSSVLWVMPYDHNNVAFKNGEVTSVEYYVQMTPVKNTKDVTWLGQHTLINHDYAPE